MCVLSLTKQQLVTVQANFNVMKLSYDNSVQLKHVTSEIFTVFSLDCELILEVLEHAVLSSCAHMKVQSKYRYYYLNTKVTATINQLSRRSL